MIEGARVSQDNKGKLCQDFTEIVKELAEFEDFHPQLFREYNLANNLYDDGGVEALESYHEKLMISGQSIPRDIYDRWGDFGHIIHERR